MRLDSLPQIGELDVAQIARLAKRGRRPDLDKIVLAHMREGFAYAKRCCRAQLHDDEILSAVYLALRQAVRSFNPGKGRFFAYAKVSLRSQIKREWASKNLVKNMPPTQHREVTPSKPREMFAGNDQEYDEKLNPGIDYAEPSYVEPDNDRIDFNERWELVLPIIKTKLSERERSILFLRHHAGMEFQRIGDLLDVTREAVRLSHSQALKKIRLELIRKRKFYAENPCG